MDAAQEIDAVMRAATRAAAAAAGHHSHANGGMHMSASGKNVAFAPGTSPADADGGLDEL